MAERMPSYGGQAVIEGVMMRGARTVAIAMRAPDQQIVIHKEQLSGIYRSKVVKIPFLRGLVMLWDALGLGMRALTLSANTQTGEDEKLEGPALWGTIALSLIIAIGLFFLLPAVIGQVFEHWITGDLTAFAANPLGASAANAVEQASTYSASAWWGNLLEGITRLLLLVGYIYLVGRIEEIRRVFAYHGAEHKTINAFEAGAELTPESVSRYPLEHPRCGTSFLLTLVLLSVLLFSLLGPMPLAWRMASRILLIPVLAGLAYEYIRWTALHLNSPFVRWMIKPNLALQRLTTREPSLDMLEVSIAAFQTMRTEEELVAGKQ